MLDYILYIVDRPDDLGRRNPDSLFAGKLHEDGARVDDRKSLRRPQRALDQISERSSFLPTMKLMQVTRRQIISRNNQIWFRGSDRPSQ
jgi:hypothetical protein